MLTHQTNHYRFTKNERKSLVALAIIGIAYFVAFSPLFDILSDIVR